MLPPFYPIYAGSAGKYWVKSITTSGPGLGHAQVLCVRTADTEVLVMGGGIATRCVRLAPMEI